MGRRWPHASGLRWPNPGRRPWPIWKRTPLVGMTLPQREAGEGLRQLLLRQNVSRVRFQRHSCGLSPTAVFAAPLPLRLFHQGQPHKTRSRKPLQKKCGQLLYGADLSYVRRAVGNQWFLRRVMQKSSWLRMQPLTKMDTKNLNDLLILRDSCFMGLT